MNKYYFLLALFCINFAEIAQAQYHIESITPASGGACNGAIAIAVDTANAPHTFRWSKEGETGTAIDNLCPGVYAVVIEDTYGCSWELEAEVGKIDGCYIETSETFRVAVEHVCEDSPQGSITVIPSTSTAYNYEWTHGNGNSPYAGNLAPGTYSLTVRDASDPACFVQLTYQVETKMDCGPAPPVESIPIYINEFYNGPEGREEFVELVVKGDGTCAPVDLRGFIIDDNNGDFSNPTHGICGTGFSGGHIRFKQIARWAAVAPGSKILLYNPAAKNTGITANDDPYDENGDGLYVLPVTDDGLEGTPLFPSYSNPSYTPSSAQTVTFQAAKWAYIALKDDKDAIQVRYPDGRYCHGLSYGGADFINGGLADLQISTTSTLNEAIYFNSGSINDITNYGQSPTATPAAANNPENENWLNQIACVGGTLIVNELSNGTDERSGYVELLVKSDHDCGVVDIRGYLLDDNNGNFSNALPESGIDAGHLRFPSADVWSAVPGGALIVVYNEKSKHTSIGGDDPTDSNGDKVYILSAAELEGVGRSPSIAQPQQYDLGASYGTGAWDYVRLYSYGDAMQVLAPDGGYQHGISYGGLGTVNGGPDDLLIETSNNKNGKVYYFENTNPKLLPNFSISTQPTPGRANSDLNQAYIDAFCGMEGVSVNGVATSRSRQPANFRAKLYPNPFSNLINMEVSSPEEQPVVIRLQDLLGRVLYEQKATLTQGFNDWSIDLENIVQDGIYFMSIQSTEGEVLHEEKVICVRK